MKLSVLLLCLMVLLACSHKKETNHMDDFQRLIQIQLGPDIFVIPAEYVGSRYQSGVAKDGINVTLLLPSYKGIFADGNDYELVPEKIDVIWNLRGKRFGSDAKARLANALEYRDMELIEEHANVKFYKDKLFNSDEYFYTLPNENSMIVDCSRDTPIKICRAFYYQEQLETGVFFSFRDIHLDKVEEIYENINHLISEWRQSTTER